MCYAHPGPRCSNYATKELSRARTALLASPNDAALMKKVKEARDEYATTPVGIKQLRASGQHTQTDIAQMKRGAQLKASRVLARKQTKLKLTSQPEATHSLARMACNLNMSLDDLLSRMMENENHWVRAGVAYDLDTSPETLAHLSEDLSADVREYVASNPNTPADVLGRLVKDEEEKVRESAIYRLKDRNTADLVEGLKSVYPEATADMPRKWLLSLLNI